MIDLEVVLQLVALQESQQTAFAPVLARNRKEEVVLQVRQVCQMTRVHAFLAGVFALEQDHRATRAIRTLGKYLFRFQRDQSNNVEVTKK